MDLIKEISELKDAIRKALKDGKITPFEALHISKELMDVLMIVFPLVLESKKEERVEE